MERQIFGDVDRYINGLFGTGGDVFEALLAHNTASGVPAWHISAGQGKLLQVFAHMCNARRILEIGTQGGYSTLWLAGALPSDGKVVTLEIDPHFAAVAQQNMERTGMAEKVEIRIGKALDTLEQLFNEGAAPFDMIFIDANKPPYAEYLQLSLKISRPGTIIVADNVIREGKVLDPHHTDEAVKGVQRFNKLLSRTATVTATIIQSIGEKDHDGMAIAVVNSI
ncbi:O-methyltransferase [Nemorincola caseinilytica]|uniref:O-methyltransferase n=1 Tax=Nemorincola caseinilytica TaxID=2054315 RepID=A0ABP8NF69_9BACT